MPASEGRPGNICRPSCQVDDELVLTPAAPGDNLRLIRGVRGEPPRNSKSRQSGRKLGRDACTNHSAGEVGAFSELPPEAMLDPPTRYRLQARLKRWARHRDRRSPSTWIAGCAYVVKRGSGIAAGSLEGRKTRVSLQHRLSLRLPSARSSRGAATFFPDTSDPRHRNHGSADRRASSDGAAQIRSISSAKTCYWFSEIGHPPVELRSSHRARRRPDARAPARPRRDHGHHDRCPCAASSAPACTSPAVNVLFPEPVGQAEWPPDHSLDRSAWRMR